MILPSIAFAIPLSVLVLSNFIRDVPQRAVRVDASRRRQRVGDVVAAGFPLTRPALVTVSIYNGLTIWNGFFIPPILTQSPNIRTTE